MSLPVAITGPVGRPVVEPPGGSSETANTALFFASAGEIAGERQRDRSHRRAAGPRPWSAVGRDEPQLGDARCVGAEGGGTMATVPRFTSMVATKWRWPPPSIVATSGCFA